jgi:hypothetical protein
MALTVTVTPGKQFAATETITNAKLNQLGQPTFTVTGTVATADLTDSVVTSAKTVAGAHFYTASVTGPVAGAYTLTLAGSPALADGMVVAFKANANGVPDASLGIRLIAGGGTKKLFKNRTEALVAGDIVAGQIIEARYDTAGDGGAGAWQMTSHTSNWEAYYTATATGTNAYTLTLTPPASYPLTLSDLDGRRIRFKVPNTNTGACTVAITIGGTVLTAKNLYKNFNQPLIAGDLRQYQMAEIVYEANATVSTDAFQLLSAVGNPTSDSAIIGLSRGLVIENQAASPDSKVTVTADEVVVRNAAGINYSAQAVSLTIDMGATAGNPNALDTGAEALSTWYYIWVIYNGTTVAGLFSLSATAPTLPTGYTHKALVGQVRNDGSLNFVRMFQAGRDVSFTSTNIFTAKVATAGDTYEVLAGADLLNFRAAVPPTARFCSGVLGASTTADACRHGICATNSDGTVNITQFVGEVLMNQNGAAGTLIGGFGSCEPFRVPVRNGAGSIIQWKASTIGILSRLNVSGYTC